jgi:aminopeptidase N
MSQSQVVHLKDYAPPAYLIDQIDLEFDLHEEAAVVQSRLQVRRNVADAGALRLAGQELELLRVAVDGRELEPGEYTVDAEALTLPSVPERFELSISTRIQPQLNTALEGLYKSGGMFCTQCEAEGFRRITYYLDRPDVMARFCTKIIADQARYPVLLSNGNPIERGNLEGGRHWVRWEDPFPKPSYLFALVAGDLACNRDSFTTASGREIALEIYVEPQNLDKTAYAMESLKRAMRWDEQAYGLEYDLDIYMIVAVGDFNMGAMENKGLNIFNTQYVLADPATSTDSDFEHVEAVIGHEYFHNWTGNRITCRDWFQLSLKEGLTVFREQQFSAAMGSAAVKRINDVRILRNAQFPEDAGPMAHPVRPDNYVEINNFYTSTVYNKGAEVIRMYHTLLGPEGFRRGMDRYFEHHDGQAVTCDDFLAAMASGGGRDLSQFGRWYSQAGTPVLDVSDDFDPDSGRYTLHVRQNCPPTPGQLEKAPFVIPLRMGLLGAAGEPLPLQLCGEPKADGSNRVLEVDRGEQSFVFEGLRERPLPSLLREFSAPVRLNYPYSDEQLAFLFGHDEDPFNRWDAGQRLMGKLMLQGGGQTPAMLIDAFRKTLANAELDKAFIAEALVLPSEGYLAEQQEVIDPAAIHAAREGLRRALGEGLADDWLQSYRSCAGEKNFSLSADAVGRRRLKNLALYYLAADGSERAGALCLEQFNAATNMTDRLSALALLADQATPAAEQALERFYEQWRHEPLVVDKWFRVQAQSQRADALERVRALTRHPAFELRNPNKVRALVGTFCHGNTARFHDASGAGYALLADYVLELNQINPQVAARLVTALSRWRRYEPGRRALMKNELERIATAPKLSSDVYEVVSRSLAG